MEKQTFYWNGEPCKRVRFLEVRVAETDIEAGKIPWWKAFEGKEMQVIEVLAYYGPSFFIDNTDGLGYRKLVGGGTMQFGSRHYDNVNLQIIGPALEEQINREFSPDKYAEIERAVSDYWQERNPEQWARVDMLKALAKAHNKYNEKHN